MKDTDAGPKSNCQAYQSHQSPIILMLSCNSGVTWRIQEGVKPKVPLSYSSNTPVSYWFEDKGAG